MTAARDFLAGGGEMGALMRSMDWEPTPLGAPESWPQSLRTSVSICLSCAFPIVLWWGKRLAKLYNDEYCKIIADKHPAAMGRPGAEVWAEIWDVIWPMLRQVVETGEASRARDLLLVMNRHGYVEETYFSFSYSPIRDESGGVGGVFCPVIETTERVIGERRLQTLRDLAAKGRGASAADACRAAAAVLARNPHDVPFAALFLLDREAGAARLAGAAGIEEGATHAPRTLSLDPAGAGVWPVAAVAQSGKACVVDDIAAAELLPRGAWPDPPRTALVLPITLPGAALPAAVLVAAVSPRRALDDDYRAFYDLAAGHVASAIADAIAWEEERRRAEALAELDRAKTAFFSNVSHEFRTPLTLLLGPIADALADAPQRLPEHREGLEIAQRNGLRLLRLVNSLLDFSRVEAGRVQASYEPVDLAALTAELASNFRSACEQAGLELVVDCPALGEPAWVDREMWEKIVLNLVSNAFKYTLQGRIEVALRRAGAAVELTVRDTGVGIPEAELPRVFERFHRVEGQGGRTQEGTGIGLALVQELAGLHGGAIRVESAVGKGSAFVVSIPRGRDHLPADRVGATRTLASTALGAAVFVEEALRWLPESGAAPGGAAGLPPEARPRAAPSRILVADDNADMRDYIRRLLGTHHEIEAVADGEAALAAIRARRPDLVVSDVMMPRLDGIGVLRAIRGDARLQDLPVILVSARAGEEASIEGLAAGADDYLVKPFSARELVARVDATLAMAKLRREAAAALRESEARFRNMADNAPVMMWVTDASGACVYLNRLWTEFTGQSMEDGLGAGRLGRIHPDDVAAARKAFAAATVRREAFGLEYRLRRRDGVYRWVLDAAAPRLGESGALMGFVGSVIDITERKDTESALERRVDVRTRQLAEANASLVAEIEERNRAEAALRQAEKLAAIGQLTGGVAHDFNNLLTTISGNLELLEREVAAERGQRRLRAAAQAVDRGARLTQQLLAFSRKQVLAVEQIDLGDLVRGASELIERTAGGTVRLETRLAEGLWPIKGEATQIELALLNLATNARDAMPDGGTLTLATRNQRLDAAEGELAAGDYAVVSVADTGGGMEAAVAAKAFEPFFTTKSLGKGTGLGLSQVYGVARQLGGTARIRSRPGAGTTVELFLPRDRSAAARTRPEPVVAPSRARESGAAEILVVDDDGQVREVIATTLRSRGYVVHEAASAAEAMETLRGPAGASIRLMLIDFAMPETNGAALARAARRQRPDLRIVYLTGYADPESLEVAPEERLLRKPFHSAELVDAIEASLARAAATTR
jgi:PAS domain S-box-containing protein